MKLNQKHLDLFEHILARGMSRGCSDLLDREIAMLTKEEWQEFGKAYHEWNGEPDDYDPNRVVVPDYGVVDFIKHTLINIAKEKM
jgi:hypothetical protein